MISAEVFLPHNRVAQPTGSRLGNRGMSLHDRFALPVVFVGRPNAYIYTLPPTQDGHEKAATSLTDVGVSKRA
jgi:hypothetical protein